MTKNADDKGTEMTTKTAFQIKGENVMKEKRNQARTFETSDKQQLTGYFRSGRRGRKRQNDAPKWK